MSYFSAAIKGIHILPAFRRRLERLFRDANSAWIELTDHGYELYILGERHSTSYTLEDATQELTDALLGGRNRVMPESVSVLEVTDSVWGVDMAELTRSTREALL
jgi:hypothetical protein